MHTTLLQELVASKSAAQEEERLRWQAEMATLQTALAAARRDSEERERLRVCRLEEEIATLKKTHQNALSAKEKYLNQQAEVSSRQMKATGSRCGGMSCVNMRRTYFHTFNHQEALSVLRLESEALQKDLQEQCHARETRFLAQISELKDK